MIGLEQVERLVADYDFQKLKYDQEKTNIFTIVGQTHTEHWHSAFFRWLFDANSSLRLGHFPLARLLVLYSLKSGGSEFSLRDIYQFNLNAVKFVTEKDASFDGKKRSIDIYGESDELIIVIENKVNAHENYNNSDHGQTIDYYHYVQHVKKPDQRALFFFISADEKQKADGDMYINISYQEVYDWIIEKCILHPQIPDDSKYVLEQYASNLREPVRGSKSPMALVNVKRCKALYGRHKETLDGIFAEVNNTADMCVGTGEACMVYEHYQSVLDEIFLSIDEYGRTPKNAMYRQGAGVEELLNNNVIKSGTLFHMDYAGERYFMQCSQLQTGNVQFMVLNESGRPYLDEEGNEVGKFDNSQSAGVFAVNIRNREKGIPDRIKSLDTAYWVNEQGVSLKKLLTTI